MPTQPERVTVAKAALAGAERDMDVNAKRPVWFDLEHFPPEFLPGLWPVFRVAVPGPDRFGQTPVIDRIGRF